MIKKSMEIGKVQPTAGIRTLKERGAIRRRRIKSFYGMFPILVLFECQLRNTAHAAFIHWTCESKSCMFVSKMGRKACWFRRCQSTLGANVSW